MSSTSNKVDFSPFAKGCGVPLSERTHSHFASKHILALVKNLFAIVAFFASFWLLLFNCQGQVYQLTDLGAQIGTGSYAQGINNQGQVVGYWDTTNGAHAFLYHDGMVADLGLLGVNATNNYALSICASKLIVRPTFG